MVIVGIDCRTRILVAAAVDDSGRPFSAGCPPTQVCGGLEELAIWLSAFHAPLVAVEGARGFGLALTHRLVDMNLEVIDIPTHLTASGRRGGRHRGKDDESDAVVIARVALREQNLPRLEVSHLDADLKLLADARDQLVAEGTRVRNRLHDLMLAIAPGYRATTGALSTRKALATARRLVLRARTADPVQSRLRLAAIRRLHAIEVEAAELQAEIKAAVAAQQPTNLLRICGVSTLVAGKLLGETHDVSRFPTAASFAAHAGTAPVPASSGITKGHRLNRGGNRQLNRALFTIAMVSSKMGTTGRSLPSAETIRR